MYASLCGFGLHILAYVIVIGIFPEMRTTGTWVAAGVLTALSRAYGLLA